MRVLSPLYSFYKLACGGGGCSSYSPRSAGLGSHLCWRGPLQPCPALARARVRAFLRRGAVDFLFASGMVPHTSLVAFVRCRSRVHGVACNILARLPPCPYLVVCCVSWRCCTAYSGERAGAGVFPPTLLVWPALVHIFVVLLLLSHTSLVSFARCPSCVRGVACNILVWPQHTYLTHIFSCFVCRGAVVLPMQMGVRRRGLCIRWCGM